jgi:hypothetical protein
VLELETDGTVTGTFATPAGTVAPRVLGVSQTHLFVVVGSSIYRYPIGNYAAQAGIPVTFADYQLITAAYAGGHFLLADPTTTGTAKSLADGAGNVTSHSTFTAVAALYTDGAAFVFRRAAGISCEVHRIVPGAFTLNTNPCSCGNFGEASRPSAVWGNTLAWINVAINNPYLLRLTERGATTCGAVDTVSFSRDPSGSRAIGLLSDRYALVTDDLIPGTGVQVSILDRVTAGRRGSPLPLVPLGGGSAQGFVVSQEPTPHNAVLVTGDRASLLRF